MSWKGLEAGRAWVPLRIWTLKNDGLFEEPPGAGPRGLGGEATPLQLRGEAPGSDPDIQWAMVRRP